MQQAHCVESCLKMFSALLHTGLLALPSLALVLETSILKAYRIPYQVVFGFKNSNVQQTSRPYVWLESPEGFVTDLGMTSRTDKIIVMGTTFGFAPDATDVTYTNTEYGPLYLLAPKAIKAEKLREQVAGVQEHGVDHLLKQLDPRFQADIAAAFKYANDPASRITFKGIAPAFCK